MPPIKSFRDLLVWQKAIDLAVRCHQIAKTFPRDEQSVLGYQIRKSTLSMPSNIAEGFSRHSTASTFSISGWRTPQELNWRHSWKSGHESAP